MGKQNVTGKCVGNDGVKKMDIFLSARQRERNRERGRKIYIYIEREREIARDGDR